MPRLRHQHIGATDQLGHFPGFRRWSWLILVPTHQQRGVRVQLAQTRQQIVPAKRDPSHWHDALAQTIRWQRRQRRAEILIQRRLPVDIGMKEDRHNGIGLFT
ncbi:hypothetical protein D3C84_718800 [compost metagenome]